MAAFAISLLGSGVSPARADDTLRCGSRLVSVDALTAQVAATCGEPTYRDRWYYNPALADSGYAPDIEVWTYNFGSSRLLQVLKFRNDRLVDVQTDGYGFSDTDGHCGPSAIVVGMSKYRLLAQCGEPASKRAEQVLQGFAVPRDARQYGYNPVRPVYLEHWVYNFGSSSLLRDVTLQNGRVSDVDSGTRGFDTP